jgi:hypothetical protein
LLLIDGAIEALDEAHRVSLDAFTRLGRCEKVADDDFSVSVIGAWYAGAVAEAFGVAVLPDLK